MHNTDDHSGSDKQTRVNHSYIRQVQEQIRSFPESDFPEKTLSDEITKYLTKTKFKKSEL